MKIKQMMMGAAIIGCITAAATSTVSAQEKDNGYAHPGARHNVNRMEPNTYPDRGASADGKSFSQRADRFWPRQI